MTRMVTHQKPATRLQARVQRVSPRDNPAFGGNTWGQPNWPSDEADTANDITELVFSGRRVAPFGNLEALQASTTVGDGEGVFTYEDGASFTTDQYIVLGDGSQAHYVGDPTFGWAEGAAA